MDELEPTPDGGTRPKASPDCPKCGYDVTGTNESATRDVRWFTKRNDAAGLRQLLSPRLSNLFGLLRPSLEERNAGGWTPLMTGALYGSTDAVAVLIELGADIHAKSNGNESAHEIAIQYGHQEIATLILAAVNVNALAGELVLIARRGSGFNGRPSRAYQIGEILNEKGGFPLMQQVATAVINEVGIYHRPRLERCWNGIGTWRS